MSANEGFSNPSSWLSTSRYLNRLFSQLEKYKNIKTILHTQSNKSKRKCVETQIDSGGDYTGDLTHSSTELVCRLGSTSDT